MINWRFTLLRTMGEDFRNKGQIEFIFTLGTLIL